MRVNAWTAVVSLVVSLAACSSSPRTTRVRIEVELDDAWGLEALHVSVADETTEVALSRAVTLVVPDEWGGRELEVGVSGMRGRARRARGTATVTPITGDTVVARVILAEIPCGDFCTPGATSCEIDSVVTCVRGADGCAAWTNPQRCEAPTPFCSLGTCADSCVDECAAGEARCAGPGAVQTCGQDDSDACREWTAAVGCEEGATCSAGQCRTECVSECTAGATRCIDNGVATCVDANGDDCTEWGPAVPCPSGTCAAGACAAVCVDECVLNACTADTWQQCGQFDLDPCRELSSGTSCVATDPCEVGSCSIGGGCDLGPRICDQPPAPECVDPATLRTYAAMGTCGEMGCAYAASTRGCPGGCAGGACVCPEATCEPLAFASAQQTADDVVIDATHVYWTTDTAVLRRTKTGGAIEIVANHPGAAHVALGGGYVYWANGVHVWRRLASLGAAPFERLTDAVSNTIREVVADSTHVYWISVGGVTEVLRHPHTSLTVPQELVTYTASGGIDVAIDATHAYYAVVGFQTPRIYRIPKTGVVGVTNGEPVVPFTEAPVRDIAVDDAHVYWTTQGSNAVMRRAKSLGAAPIEFVAPGQPEPKALALDATHAYWATPSTGSIVRRAKAPAVAPVETLTTGQDASSIAVDASAMFWSSTSSHAVNRLSRCACDL